MWLTFEVSLLVMLLRAERPGLDPMGLALSTPREVPFLMATGPRLMMTLRGFAAQTSACKVPACGSDTGATCDTSGQMPY